MFSHLTAFSSLIWGVASLVVFLAPLFIYASEYSDKENQSRGEVNAGDIVSMIQHGLGLHLIITFGFTFFASLISIFFRAVPSLSPAVALTNFYQLDSSNPNNFIDKWMTTNFLADTQNGSSIGDAALVGFDFFMKMSGVVLTFIYLMIVMIIVFMTMRYSMSGKAEMRDESGINKVLSSVIFFVGSTLLLFVHSLIASSFVKFVASSSDSFEFSFFESLNIIWQKLLFG